LAAASKRETHEHNKSAENLSLTFRFFLRFSPNCGSAFALGQARRVQTVRFNGQPAPSQKDVLDSLLAESRQQLIRIQQLPSSFFYLEYALNNYYLETPAQSSKSQQATPIPP